MINIINVLMTNPQLSNMIYKWLECKHSATLYTAAIALITIIIFTLCLVIPAPKHFYKKIVISVIAFLCCTTLLSISSQIRYHDSQEVAAFQKIQANRQLGTKIPAEKHEMHHDDILFHKYKSQKHPNLHSYMKAKDSKKQYESLHHLLYERKLFNLKNNHVKNPQWYNNF